MAQALTRSGSGAAVARRAGSAAAAADTTTHGQWVRFITQIVGALIEARKFEQEMLERLSAVDADRRQMQAVQQWAQNFEKAYTFIRARLIFHDKRLEPLITAIEKAGGWQFVAVPAYYSEY